MGNSCSREVAFFLYRFFTKGIRTIEVLLSPPKQQRIRTFEDFITNTSDTTEFQD